ncbi:hypothetical protein [Alkalibacillus haloalkaliphilus]|uniref:hypothetical protein n=1 Tax=Alkalibacillus haloalkaliphilus TaxID=94136 RepID=UPI00293596E7|nr:hypothetical protein [Alkalibacillus haloalkaliphilus]MDV2580731.1 hypothetical protein [Alkalibacillus haloalkaliphilus]
MFTEIMLYTMIILAILVGVGISLAIIMSFYFKDKRKGLTILTLYSLVIIYLQINLFAESIILGSIALLLIVSLFIASFITIQKKKQVAY